MADRKIIGSENYKKGYAFEDKIADLYRLLHYDVQQGRFFSGSAELWLMDLGIIYF